MATYASFMTGGGADATAFAMSPSKDWKEVIADGEKESFEHYATVHARTVEALSDDFDSVFGKAFARAYERVVLGDDDGNGSRGR